jgi:DnaJ-class molecular chaperone
MESGITWYDVLDVLPGADPAKIRREYEAKANLLRPELISGAPSNVLQAIFRAQGMLDSAWEVLGDPASRERYDLSIGLRGPGGHLREPGSNPDGSGPGPSDLGIAGDPAGGAAGGALTRTGWPRTQRRRAKQHVAVPDMRGLFYNVCLEVAARRNVHITTVRLTPHPMPVEGLVVDQSPRPPATLQRHGELTIYVWHPMARAT